MSWATLGEVEAVQRGHGPLVSGQRQKRAKQRQGVLLCEIGSRHERRSDERSCHEEAASYRAADAMPPRADDMDYMDSDFDDAQQRDDDLRGGDDPYGGDPGATPGGPASGDGQSSARTPPHTRTAHYRLHTPHQGRSRSHHGSPPVGATPLAAPPPAWSPDDRRRPASSEPTSGELLAAILQSKADTVREIRSIADIQAAQGEAINDLSERTRQVEVNTEQTARDVSDLAARVSALEQRPQSVPSSAPSSTPSTTSSARASREDPFEVDKTIVRLSTNSPVTASSMRQALQPVLARAGYAPKDIDIKGPQIGLRFVLKHRNLDRSAARDFVDNVLDARREPGGGWMDIHIVSPMGDNIVVYVSRDASKAQRRTAWHLARAARALRAVAPARAFEVAKSAAAVVYQWKAVAKCRYNHDSDNADIEWNQDLCQQLGVDLVKVQEEYHDMVQRGPRPQRG